MSAGQCCICGNVADLAPDGTERCWLCVRADLCHTSYTAAVRDNCACLGRDADLLRSVGAL